MDSDLHARGLLAEYWKEPDSTDALQVWADALVERGDPRGEYVQHCLQGAEPARRALEKKLGGKLVGPARGYLREWRFGEHGLVELARCEADKLAAGLEEIARLHPRLILTVTSLKKKAQAERLGALSLAPIYCVDFTSITGTHGGTQLPDPLLQALAPALRGVRNLALSCRGYAGGCFSPDGLRLLGEHLEGLELLALDHYRAGEAPHEDAGRPRIAPVAGYAEVIAYSPGFRGLKALVLPGADAAPLRRGLPHLVTLETSPSHLTYQALAVRSWRDLERMKTAGSEA